MENEQLTFDSELKLRLFGATFNQVELLLSEDLISESLLSRPE